MIPFDDTRRCRPSDPRHRIVAVTRRYLSDALTRLVNR